MGKKNKIRYTATPKKRVALTLSGNVYLQHDEEDAQHEAQKGDLLVYPECRQLQTNHLGQYQNTGFTGYFKLDVYDGADWQPLLMGDIFPHEENYFSRTEKPRDTYRLIREMLLALKGRTLTRTYREHYELEAVEEE